MKLKYDSASDFSTQSSTGMVSCRRPRSASMATSQALMQEMWMDSSLIDRSISLRAAADTSPGSLTHQIQTWVSSTIIAELPSLRQQRAPWDLHSGAQIGVRPLPPPSLAGHRV